MKKITLFVCVLFLTSISLLAQDLIPTRPDNNRLAKFILSDAQIAFENNDFSSAFTLAQEAVDTRKAESEWSVYTLATELRKPSAQNVGKDIEQLLYFFRNRQSYDVVNIIERVLYDFSYEYFDFSIDNVLYFLEQSQNYPEAFYLLGRLYLNEGELAIADSYFIQAYEHVNLLDIPDVQFDILYSMADLYAIQENWNAFEEVLLLVASEDDSYYLNGAPSPFLHSVTSALNNNMTADRFFLLFRNDFYVTLQAWNYLTYYYEDQGQSEKALETALLFTTSALQRIDEVLEDRDIHYEYSDLRSFFQNVKLFNDVAVWAENNYFWEGFYVLAILCKEQGYEQFSQTILINLASECPVHEWRVLAERAL